MDIEVYADEYEDVMLFIYSPEYQDPEPPTDPCGCCGGTGIAETFTQTVMTPLGDVPWEDHTEVPCSACGGTGSKLPEAA